MSEGTKPSSRSASASLALPRSLLSRNALSTARRAFAFSSLSAAQTPSSPCLVPRPFVYPVWLCARLIPVQPASGRLLKIRFTCLVFQFHFSYYLFRFCFSRKARRSDTAAARLGVWARQQLPPAAQRALAASSLAGEQPGLLHAPEHGVLSQGSS